MANKIHLSFALDSDQLSHINESCALGSIELQLRNELVFKDTFFDMRARAEGAGIRVKKREFMDEHGNILQGAAYWQLQEVKPKGIFLVNNAKFSVQGRPAIQQKLLHHVNLEDVSGENFSLREVGAFTTIRKEFAFQDRVFVEHRVSCSHLIYKPKAQATDFIMVVDEMDFGVCTGKFELCTQDINDGMRKMEGLLARHIDRFGFDQVEDKFKAFLWSFGWSEK